ncbi:MAG: hypothetical protein QM692_03225 [Thermomicrobiales bacterium]
MRRSTPRYEIIFIPRAAETPVVVHAALSADEATLLFAVELQRHLTDHAHGELAIRRKAANSANPAVIIRQELATA